MKQIISMFDGSTKHGGLTNRLAGIISFYEIAKFYHKKFGIHFIFPFHLEKFLQPKNHDWIARKKDLHLLPVKRFKMMDNRVCLDDMLNSLNYREGVQYHVYSNIDILDIFYDENEHKKAWSKNFHELFQVSPFLRKELNKYKFSDDYVAVQLRFLNLFGDFKDTSRKLAISYKDQHILMNECKEIIDLIKKKHPKQKVFVSSDSQKFLNFINKDNQVMISSGDIKHSDMHSRGRAHIRTFVDLFLLAEASHIYNIKLDNMHKSYFPVYASYINNVPFTRVWGKDSDLNITSNK